MKELIVGGVEGTTYIVNINGEQTSVKKGDILQFETAEEATKLMDSTRTMSGQPLFFLYEKVKKEPKKGVKKNAENS